MSIRCAMSGCTNTKANSGRIFVRCEKCGAWWCSLHGTQGNRCPGCDHKYLVGGGSSSGGGCFITSSTLLALSKGENCAELNVFRNYRDNWLLKQPKGNDMIEEYYRIAPVIVSKIDNCINKAEIYKGIWDGSLSVCLKLIEESKFDEAKNLYMETLMCLKKQYIDENNEISIKYIKRIDPF